MCIDESSLSFEAIKTPFDWENISYHDALGFEL